MRKSPSFMTNLMEYFSPIKEEKGKKRKFEEEEEKKEEEKKIKK